MQNIEQQRAALLSFTILLRCFVFKLGTRVIFEKKKECRGGHSYYCNKLFA